MKLHFWGASRQVTGSRFCLEGSHGRLLIDCGMFQEREYSSRNWEPLPCPPDQIDAVLVTHAHIDHCGLLPRLVRHGFRGPIFVTRPTVELLAIMLRDAAKIQAEDLAYKQKRHRREGRVGSHPYEPLFDDRDVTATLPLLQGVRFGESIRVLPGCQATYHDAGHILGSASIELTIPRPPDSRPMKIVFSGDVGQVNKPLLNDPADIPRADYLIMESTYGDRLHQEAGDIPSQLQQVIQSTVERGGKVVIPTFAIERAQELIHILSQLVHHKRIPFIPVYLDSPMAVDVTAVFLRYADYLDRDALQMISEGKPPLHFPGLQLCRSTEESKAINDHKGPAVILSTAGMCNAGRIKHHLRQTIGDPRNTILFVGYQSHGTLGREILDGKDTVRIHGGKYPVRAKVARIFGFSGHADRDGLLRWAQSLAEPPKRTFLVHGDEQAALALADGLAQHGWNVHVPRYQEVVEIDG